MLFKKHHISMIRDGSKTHTRRIWKFWHVIVGNTYAAQSYWYQPRKECPIIKCTDKYKQRLGDMTEEDAYKEGDYTLEGYKEEWERINKIKWDDEFVPFVVVFEYVGEGKEEQSLTGKLVSPPPKGGMKDGNEVS